MSLESVSRERLKLWIQWPDVMMVEEFEAEPAARQLEVPQIFPRVNRLAWLRLTFLTLLLELLGGQPRRKGTTQVGRGRRRPYDKRGTRSHASGVTRR